ncbi:hypothetical protein [Actinokineospora iranica]|uniref:Uncharacterized protein n=1 Tax=Actinokineospora iranica TaxID=1271860 RepID=A0A1G6SBG6_9PSEU|nr:hypothetical protein [Actinokineospora iranica]SDD13477.1 hypothetical protein SAMN05216174_107300 [Actinokineospora iranica]
MSNDIFDHPELRDPEWNRVARRAVRGVRWRRLRNPRRPGPPAFWWRHRVKIISVGVLLAILGLGVVAVGSVERGAVPPRASGAPTTTATVPSEIRRVDLAQPFVGTPAAGWSDGESGVVAPTPVAVNGFTAAQVAAATEQIRRVLVAARLDPEVLRGGNLESFVALFAPKARDQIATDSSNRTNLAPEHRLLDVAPKVDGRMTVEPGAEGELVVRTSYVFAYAFAPHDPTVIHDPLDIVSVVRVDADYIYRAHAKFAESSVGLWPGKLESFYYAMSCAALEKGLLAPYYTERGKYAHQEVAFEKEQAFDLATPVFVAVSCPDS